MAVELRSQGPAGDTMSEGGAGDGASEGGAQGAPEQDGPSAFPRTAAGVLRAPLEPRPGQRPPGKWALVEGASVARWLGLGRGWGAGPPGLSWLPSTDAGLRSGESQRARHPRGGVGVTARGRGSERSLGFTRQVSLARLAGSGYPGPAQRSAVALCWRVSPDTPGWRELSSREECSVALSRRPAPPRGALLHLHPLSQLHRL